MIKDCEQVLFVTFAKDGIYQIQCSGLIPGPGHVYCTLIVGEEKCMLIDCGIGDDDFDNFPPELVPLMAGKELVCVATHAHGDHIGGYRHFDAIWLMLQDHSVLKDWFGDTYNETIGMLGDTRILDLPDGHIFDLGGRTVKAIATPGHTWGSCCFYDDKAQIMLAGDALNRHVMYHCVTPAVPLCVCAEKLENLLSYRFDIILGSHHREPFPRSFITYMVQLIRSFDIKKAEPYRREGAPANIRNFHVGRGYGDPAYAAIILNVNNLDDYLK